MITSLIDEKQSLQGCKEDALNNTAVAYLGYHNHEMAIKLWKQGN